VGHLYIVREDAMQYKRLNRNNMSFSLSVTIGLNQTENENALRKETLFDKDFACDGAH
jgi:hypothetical protein